MPHMDIYDEVATMKGAALTPEDKAELDMRVKYAKKWLDEYADEKFIFALQETLPETSLTKGQSLALVKLAEQITASESFDGEVLHKLIHEVKESSDLTPKEFFGAIYALFLGKDSGPKVGWFLSSLDKNFVVTRLKQEG